MPRPVSNPPNPWHTQHVELLEPAPDARLEVHEEQVREILAENDSPDVPFRWSINPYRGCYHGCAYCYARPFHQYLDWGAGTDFDRRIVVRTNAAERLAEAFRRPSWTGETVAFSGVTDPYQPLEAAYGITRACLEVCLDARNPVGIVTKGALVRRDADLLATLERKAGCAVFVSIPFDNDDDGRAIEPWASPVSRRFETLRVLADAGVPVGVGVAPLIPGLNDSQVAGILERAAECGATRAFRILLRLPAEVEPVFEERLREAMPLRADRVLNALREMRGGAVTNAGFGERMSGSGARWRALDDLFRTTCRRVGLNARTDAAGPDHLGDAAAEEREPFRRPLEPGQKRMFD